ncbi:MAG: hypothetical protein LBS74_00265 [Oscillospiraceae bacterium]|jgi:undecaprenyl-diphosphatase|nr:hypothetical protein [Oscillospiraceae bacterium]
MSKKINIAAGFSLVVFALTAILTVSGYLDTLNNSLSEASHSLENPALTIILKIITSISEWFVYVPIALLLFAIPKLRWRVGFPVTVTLMASGMLNWTLKQLFAIPRPDTHRLIAESGLSFPRACLHDFTS